MARKSSPPCDETTIFWPETEDRFQARCNLPKDHLGDHLDTKLGAQWCRFDDFTLTDSNG